MTNIAKEIRITLEAKEIDIKRIHGDNNFQSTLIDSYRKTLELYDNNPNINPETTPYYKTIINNYTKRGLPWFGHTTKEGVREKTEKFMKLYSDIKRFYDPETYGYIECIPQEDGTLEVFEGHHRLTILRKLRYKTVYVIIK